MKSGIITVILFCIIAQNISAQVIDSIIIKKENRKTVYLQNGRYLSQKELVDVLKSRPESAAEYHYSSSLDKIGAVLVFPGAIITGLGGFVSVSHILGFMGDVASISGDTDKASEFRKYAGIAALSGIGLIAAGCTFHLFSISVQKKSVNIYNGIHPSAKIISPNLYFGFTGSGAGVKVRF